MRDARYFAELHNLTELLFTANFCKKKFRTLRERFTRELRKSYLEPSVAVKYEYFKDLQFLSPYIKFRSISFESADGKTVVTKRDDGTIMKEEHHTVDEKMMIEQDTYFAEETDNEQQFIQEAGGSQSIIYESVPEFSSTTHQIHEVVQASDEELNLSPQAMDKSKDRKRKLSWEQSNEDDDNKCFAMSVASSLRRLSTIYNMKARVEIYQVLEKFTTKQELERK